MVRAWHWDVIPILDDERLTANHSEAHMMLRALKRGGGGWFSNPETQVWYEHPEWLAWIHDFTVGEMARRGYPSGASHQTPAEYTADTLGLFDFYESAAPGYKTTPREWLNRDYADLYVKWNAENRWDSEGYAILGRRKRDHDRTPQPAKWYMPLHLRHTTHRDYLKKFDERVGPRELIDYDRPTLKKLVSVRRKF